MFSKRIFKFYLYWVGLHLQLSLTTIVGALADSSVENLSPQTATEFYERAIFRHDSSDFEGAIADYTESLQLEDDFLIAYVSRGKAFHALMQHEEAKKDFKHYLEANLEEKDADFEEFSEEIFSLYPELK